MNDNSLFSTIFSLYVLLLLYFPSLSLQFILSPVIFSTLILLLYLLRLGASQNCTIESESESVQSSPQQKKLVEEFLDADLGESGFESEEKQKSRPIYADSFLEWDVRAPLEVIYEDHEGEDAEENDDDSESKRESQMNIIQRYASLSLFYPESDSDASSEGDFTMNGGWDSPEGMCFRWEEDDREGNLIEIALDDRKRNNEVDEDNLIEIDLSPAR